MGSKTGDKAPRMFNTRVSIEPDQREKVVGLLNQRLADTLDLFTQCKQAHWNVKGADFYQLHLLFDELAEKVEAQVDTIAERVTALGGTAKGTARMAAQASTLPEFEATIFEDRACVEALAERFATIGQHVREDIDKAEKLGDAGTADLFTAQVRELDQSLYFLEAHLQRGGR